MRTTGNAALCAVGQKKVPVPVTCIIGACADLGDSTLRAYPAAGDEPCIARTRANPMSHGIQMAAAGEDRAHPGPEIVVVDEESEMPQMEFLKDKFDLTPAEARLVVRLITGESLRPCAKALGIKYETVRTYLKS